MELENPDFIFEESVRQALLGDGRIWLEIESGVGAHGGCYDLVNYDGTTFQNMVSHCHSSPLASKGMGDFNGDGVLDLATADNIGGTASILLGATTDGIAPLLSFSLKTSADARQAMGIFENKLENKLGEVEDMTLFNFDKGIPGMDPGGPRYLDAGTPGNDPH